MAKGSNGTRFREMARQDKAERKQIEREQRRQQKRVGPAHDRQPEQRP